jgi:NADH-quinone oxidoreductase subunit C
MFDINKLYEDLNVHFNKTLELSTNGQAIYVKREHVVELIKLLKNDFNYKMLADITSADYEDRYEVVYHLLNDKFQLLTVKVKLEKGDSVISSITSIWKAADPQEREIFDLMGIVFEGHGNLKRILCPEDFIGHPLQKSFILNTIDRF